MIVQDARPEHIPGIFQLRLAVRENVLTLEQVRRHGLTAEQVADAFRPGRKGWVVEADGRVIGVSIADAADGSIFGLFVLPGYEGRGLGRALLEAAVDWLWEQGADRVWLSTAPGTRADEFYRRLGWQAAGTTPKGEVRFELSRPARSS
jgi:GNAT superfamily N-acetyltransferase